MPSYGKSQTVASVEQAAEKESKSLVQEADKTLQIAVQEDGQFRIRKVTDSQDSVLTSRCPLADSTDSNVRYGP